MKLMLSAVLLRCLGLAAAASDEEASPSGAAMPRIARFRTLSDLTSEEELDVFSETQRLADSIETKRKQLAGRLGVVFKSLNQGSSYTKCMADHRGMLEHIGRLQERLFAALVGSGLYSTLDAREKDEILAASPEELKEHCRYDDGYQLVRDKILSCERAGKVSCDGELQKYRRMGEHYAEIEGLLGMLLGEVSTPALYESYCDDWRSLYGRRRNSCCLEN